MTLRLTGFLLFLPFIAFAQPANDECESAIDLGVAPYCENTLFTNVGATASNIGANNIPACWDNGTVQRDVWFVFTASDTILDYSITITGEGADPLTNPQVAIYRGDCGPNNLFFFSCFKAETAGATSLKFSFSGLTPGAQYWLRIADFPESGSNAGTFRLCIEQKSPITNITEGFSKDCEGILVDSGGPDGDYGPNETYTFTICPEFPSACIELNFIYYNIDFGQDVITIYDGPNTTSPLIGTISSGFGGGTFTDSWGGVCKKFNATSGCMTVRFTSNAVNQYDGFLAEWKCSSIPCKVLNQPQIQTSFTETEVLQNLSSTQAIVNFDKLICPEGASGLFFNGDQTDLGLNKGILLTTGSAQLALGPNNIGSAGFPHNAPGDNDLDILSALGGNIIESFDACILELDVYANTNEITFEYVFGSEEYPEYAGTNFNDIFAFLISGPGISGIPQIGNQDNMAVLPDGSPVEINAVNHQLNWEYYRPNNGGVSLQYDGLTSDFLGKKKSLTARYTVEPCQTYHLKLAIADRGDSSFDSGVFISEIKGGAPSIAMDFKNGIDYLVEDCTNNPDEVVISLNSALNQPVSYEVTIGGTATLGVDYTLDIPAMITFQPGETQLVFPIVPLSDGITEGDETITITLSNNFGCGNVIFAVFTIIIRDGLEITVNGGLDTVFFCPGNSVALAAEGALTYFWEPVGLFSEPTAAATVASPTGSSWVQVTGQLGICTAVDSIFLLEVNPQVSITTPRPVSICRGSSVLLNAANNLDGQGSVTWSPTFGLNNPNSAQTLARPSFSTFYTVTASLTGCTATDTITVSVIPFDFPNVIPSLDICQGSSIPLANNLFSGSTTYTWTPPTGLSATDVSGPIATPEVTTTYKLVAVSQGGVCADSAEVTLTVLPAALEIPAGDTAFICLGDTLTLNANFTPGGMLSWSPSDSSKLIQDGIVAQVFGGTSFWAFAEMTIGPCKRRDSVFVRIDSLPNLNISRFVDRPFYCEGELITFLSPNYLNKDYPDIRHLWSPNNGAFLSPDSNLNLILTARESATYTRRTRNNACLEEQSVTIEVIPLGLMLSQDQVILCEGETTQVSILDEGIENIEWTPGNGLSCSTCPDPVITGTTTLVYQIKGEEKGCNKQGNVFVTVPVPVLNLPDNLILCQGETGNLNPNAGAGTSYQWTSTDPGFGGSSEPDPAITPLLDGVYFVTATLQGCTRTGEVPVAVIVPPTLSLSANPTNICVGEQVVLTASGSPVGGTYAWSPGGQTGTQITVSPPVSTSYSVTYTTVRNCFSDSANVVIQVDPPLNITLQVNPEQDTFVLGTPMTITAETAPPAPAGSTYVWRINGQVVGNTSGNVLETIASGPPFVVSVSITSPAGCENNEEEEYRVTVPTYKVPNLFSPNRDGTNDTFRPILDPGLTVTGFKIYSRWGNLVFDNPSDPNGWDGTFNGKDLPSDVYAYVIILRYDDGQTVTLRGDVTLLR